jgi:hypothetical protein
MSKIYSLSLHFNNTMNINTHRLNKLGIFYFTKETLFNKVIKKTNYYYFQTFHTHHH